MRLLPISSIQISANRQRQDFAPDDLMALTESLRDCGLMHAIVVRDEGESVVLVAGERRLRAIKDMFMLGDKLKFDGNFISDGLVPTVTLGELDELSAEEAELDENFKRKDLTWQEHAAALERLHNLRVKQQALAGPLVPGGPQPVHTVADTAREVRGSAEGWNQDIVRKELIVARNLHNPEVMKAKSVEEAFKTLKKQEASKRNSDLAATVGLTFSAKDHTLIRGDCIEVMARPEMLSKFDVIVTDPPYGMGAHEFGDGGGKLSGIEHHYDDSYENWQALLLEWAKKSFVVTKPQAHAYVFCDFDRFHELKQFMQDAGWYVFRTPLICYKQNSGRVPLPDRGPRRQYELILYAIKGNKPVTHIYSDVIPSNADESTSHGAQKPVALFQNLLQRSVQPGDEVLDCFAGSGTIFPAAHTMKCKATGIERHPDYQGMCLKRINDLLLDDMPGLF